jgi:endo-1,4-beta-xylanase
MSLRLARAAGPSVSRRDVLVGSLSLAGMLGLPASGPDARPLWTVPYGAAVRPEPLELDAGYRDAILRHCSVIVPEGGMKWLDVRPAQDVFDFRKGDAIVSFARENALAVRGHTLAWAGAMPDWTRTIGKAEAQTILVDHVRAVVARYAGRIGSWDVINEPIAEKPVRIGELRNSIWLQQLGPAYAEIALRTAAGVDSSARLLVNEYDIEWPGEPYRTKRDSLLRFLEELKARDVPLHGVGIQGHLRGDREVDHDGLAAFVEAVKAMGLSVSVTELDVIDDRIPGPAAAVDAMVALKVKTFLAAIFGSCTPEAVLSWGLSDRYSWVPIYFSRHDGQPNRPLPLDKDYREKPFMNVIRTFCA